MAKAIVDERLGAFYYSLSEIEDLAEVLQQIEKSYAIPPCHFASRTN